MEPKGFEPLRPGRRFGDRFEVKEQLGRGGVSEVFRAFDRERGIDVALKVLQPELGPGSSHHQRFAREARAIGRLRHPNIVQVLDDGEHEGLAYIAMELVRGSSLQLRLQRAHVLGPREVRAVAVGVARALEAAHRAGVVHRDVKPGNILLREERIHPGAVAVCDFGLAKLLDESGRFPSTLGPIRLGTPAYLAPELAAGGPADARSDLFALGVVLFEAASGERPFPTPTDSSPWHHAVREAPPRVAARVPDLDPALADVIDRCLALEPADRLGSAAEVLARLDPPAEAAPGSREAASNGRSDVKASLDSPQEAARRLEGPPSDEPLERPYPGHAGERTIETAPPLPARPSSTGEAVAVRKRSRLPWLLAVVAALLLAAAARLLPQT